MGSFEETYDDDELRSFKPTQLKKLQELHVQLDSKFNEIVELLARELNHAKNDPRVHDEAESAIQRWAEDAQMAKHPIETKGELQRLLKEHHQIAEEIMDVRDWDGELAGNIPPLAASRRLGLAIKQTHLRGSWQRIM
jgi:hypothetical protein